MKKSFYLSLFGGVLLTACTPSSRYEVSGALTGVASDTLLVRSFAVTPSGQPDEVQMDTVPMADGKFSLNIKNDVLKQVYIWAKPSMVPDAQGRIAAMSMRPAALLLLPGKQVTIKGSLDDFTLGGDAFYEAYNSVQAQLKPFEEKLDSLSAHCSKMSQEGAPADSVHKAYAPSKQILEDMRQVAVDYIRSHADQDVSLFILSQTPIKLAERQKLLDEMAEPVKTGVMKPLYEMMKQSCEREVARNAAREKIKEGVQAPDFTLKTIEGKDFSLSSLKGKYVVLDFWGSWCGWCIKGFPEMKKAYEAHKSKIEFVGVDCNDKETKWKKAVAEHQLPWINVYNAGNPDVAIMYGVSGYPTKMVIDKEGKIIKIVVGEDPEFYTFLNKLLK